jgi:hypothetical protein
MLDIAQFASIKMKIKSNLYKIQELGFKPPKSFEERPRETIEFLSKVKKFMKKLSIIIPVYFNELNLNKTYDVLKKDVLYKLPNLGFDYEIIFIDDGSKDRSLEILKELKSKNIDNITETISKRKLDFENNLKRIIKHELTHINQRFNKKQFKNYIISRKRNTEPLIRANPDLDEYIYKDKITGLELYYIYSSIKPNGINDIIKINNLEEHPNEIEAYEIEKQ